MALGDSLGYVMVGSEAPAFADAEARVPAEVVREDGGRCSGGGRIGSNQIGPSGPLQAYSAVHPQAYSALCQLMGAVLLPC